MVCRKNNMLSTVTKYIRCFHLFKLHYIFRSFFCILLPSLFNLGKPFCVHFILNYFFLSNVRDRSFGFRNKLLRRDSSMNSVISDMFDKRLIVETKADEVDSSVLDES